MSSLHSNDKTVVLLPPDKEFLKQFFRKRKMKKIVWSRKSMNDNVIALDEWDRIAVLRYIYAIPVAAIALISFLLFLVFIGPYYYINKEKTNRLFEKYMKGLHFLLKETKHYPWVMPQKEADEIICNKSEKPQYYILYLHEKEKKVLKRLDENLVGKYIDQIWVYRHTAEIFERIVKDGYQNPYSKIVDFQVISTNSIWRKKYRNNTSKTLAFNWVGNVDLHMLLFNVSSIPSIEGNIYKPRIPAPRITLHPNDVLDNSIVFYFESTYNEKLNQYLSNNYKVINEKLAKKGMRLLYFPKMFFDNKQQSLIELQKYVSYKFPHLFMTNEQSGESLLQQVFKNTNVEDFYTNIASALGIPDILNPCFIHCVDKETKMTADRKYRYSIHQFINWDDESLKKEINHYVELVSIPKDEIFFSLATPNPEDPDDRFYMHGTKVSEELTGFIEHLKLINDEKLIMDSLVFLIKKLTLTQPELCAKLNNTLYKKIANTNHEASRLLIDEQYRIILLDYNNLEISMTPLQKTLYIFFLKNKDGIKLKELSTHKAELIDIYCKVGNRLDMEQVRKSISDLTNATSNSVNEKCSKIKEAFLSKIDDTIAQQYYITGNRSENKRIILDRSLVIFSQTK